MKIDPIYIVLLIVLAGVFFINLCFYLLNQKRKFEHEAHKLNEENISLKAEITILKTVEKKHRSSLLDRQLTKDLTDAELKVAVILVEGFEDKEIADKLGKSIFTINQHIRNMREKAGCRNTKELIAYLLRNDIV